MDSQSAGRVRASDGPWWAYRGVGIARSWGEVRFRDIAALVLVAAAVWGRVDVVKRGEIRSDFVEIHKTDLTVFTEAGAAFFDGRDPYKVTNARGWYYLYPPLFAQLIAPLSVFDAQSQVGFWLAISVATGFGCFFEARALWRRLAPSIEAGDRPARRGVVAIVAAGVLVAALPTLDCLQRGQVGVLLLYSILLGLRLVLDGRVGWRTAAGGVVLALPIVVKLIPLLPVASLLALLGVAAWAGVGRDAGRRFGATAAGVALGLVLFLVAIPSALVGARANARHLESWATGVVTNPQVHKAHGFDIFSLRNQSLANSAHLLARQIHGPSPDKPGLLRLDAKVDRVSRAARGLTLAMLAACLVALGRRGDPLSIAAGLGLSSTAMLLVSPLSWGHYFMLGLPASLFFPLWVASRGRRRLAIAFGAVPAALSLLQYLALYTAGAYGLLGLGTFGWFAAATVASVRLGASAADGPPAPGRAGRHVGRSHLRFRRTPARDRVNSNGA